MVRKFKNAHKTVGFQYLNIHFLQDAHFLMVAKTGVDCYN